MNTALPCHAPAASRSSTALSDIAAEDRNEGLGVKFPGTWVLPHSRCSGPPVRLGGPAICRDFRVVPGRSRTSATENAGEPTGLSRTLDNVGTSLKDWLMAPNGFSLMSRAGCGG